MTGEMAASAVTPVWCVGEKKGGDVACDCMVYECMAYECMVYECMAYECTACERIVYACTVVIDEKAITALHVLYI
jgi:hypothetical protein